MTRTSQRLGGRIALTLAILTYAGGGLAAAAGPDESWPTAAELAIPAWPVSDGLLIGEIVTGGASASDEYVELYNAGDADLELSGFELVYVTASGGTITRKASWVAQTLWPGMRLLV